MYYQLTANDENFEGSLGLIRCINTNEIVDFNEQIEQSWYDFHHLEEHELDNCNIDDFVVWHNENYTSQIERFFITIL